MKRMRTGAVLGVGLAAFVTGGCRERGRPDPNIQMAVSHEPDAAASETAGDGGVGGSGGSGATRIPNRLEVPEAVGKAYSGIVLLWKDSQSGKEGKLEVPLGGSATAVPDSTLTVTADVFLPAFTMTSDVITSSGIEPENPAARIQVMDGGKPVFAGWIFQRFPDVHPFTHPRFSLKLDGGVRKNSA
jgi:hypothetical protein